MFNVVLFEPEIPSNTGNIGRTCVVTGSRLHLIGPLGFSLGDDMLRRAGLGYWHSLDVTTYAGWEEFLAQNGLGETDERLHLLMKKARKTYAQATTNVLSALGYDMSKVYTLEGGFNAWSETYPDNVEA